jgi:hypothetical protein
MPPKIEIAQIFGTALYAAKGVLAGRRRRVGAGDRQSDLKRDRKKLDV